MLKLQKDRARLRKLSDDYKDMLHVLLNKAETKPGLMRID